MRNSQAMAFSWRFGVKWIPFSRPKSFLHLFGKRKVLHSKKSFVTELSRWTAVGLRRIWSKWKVKSESTPQVSGCWINGAICTVGPISFRRGLFFSFLEVFQASSWTCYSRMKKLFAFDFEIGANLTAFALSLNPSYFVSRQRNSFQETKDSFPWPGARG